MSSQTKYIKKLDGKRVLVFGGTSGIGFAVSEAAVEFGAIVTISGSTQAKLDRSLERLRTAYPDAANRIFGYTCDLATIDTIEPNLLALFEKVTNGGTQKIDHIAFTAGDFPSDFKLPTAAEFEPKHFISFITVRGIAAGIVAKLSLKYLNQSAESSITLTGGVNTHKPSPGWALPAFIGGAVEAMVRGLAVDLKPVRVNTVAPGAIDTELFAAVPEAGKEMYKSKTLVHALGQPGDTAEAYIYAMKDKFVNGSTIHTNGGYLLV